MRYTDEQFNALAPFEDNFRTAVEGDWTRRVATNDQHKIKDIYEAATKTRIPFNVGCGSCLLTLLKRAGRMYFADKKERVAKTLDESIKNPDLSVKKFDDGSVEVKTTYVGIETPAPKKAAPKKNYSKKAKTAKKNS